MIAISFSFGSSPEKLFRLHRPNRILQRSRDMGLCHFCATRTANPRPNPWPCSRSGISDSNCPPNPMGVPGRQMVSGHEKATGEDGDKMRAPSSSPPFSNIWLNLT